MKNKDILEKEKTDILQKLNQAVKEGDEKAFAGAWVEFADNIQQQVLEEARQLVNVTDTNILASRGVRQLTSEEKQYYQSVIDAMKTSNPKQAVSNIDKTVPKTIIDTVFEDIRTTHPLLDMIDFQNTGMLIEFLFSTSSGVAAWGDLTDEITSELSGSFDVVDLTQKKLSAFIPVGKAMLDLGPEWLDRYVRALLLEAIAAGSECGIVDGDGNKKPIGMTRALTGATDSVYPRKTAVVITDLSAATFGTILNTLSQGPSGKRRSITQIILVVNPADYFTKIMPASTVRTTDGAFRSDVFPFPTRVIQSPDVPSGYAIFGLAPRYFFGLGTSKGGKIEYSDEYKFLEDQRVYLIKLYGNGRPKDANAFVLADISGLTPYVQQVYVSNETLQVFPTYDARLASLSVGSLSLSPAFNKSVFSYTAATTNATNTVTAVAKDGEAVIEIKNGETTVANGAAATWAEGENTLTVSVTSGTETETYTVTVTKS